MNHSQSEKIYKEACEHIVGVGVVGVCTVAVILKCERSDGRSKPFTMVPSSRDIGIHALTESVAVVEHRPCVSAFHGQTYDSVSNPVLI